MVIGYYLESTTYFKSYKKCNDWKLFPLSLVHAENRPWARFQSELPFRKQRQQRRHIDRRKEVPRQTTEKRSTKLFRRQETSNCRTKCFVELRWKSRFRNHLFRWRLRFRRGWSRKSEIWSTNGETWNVEKCRQHRRIDNERQRSGTVK